MSASIVNHAGPNVNRQFPPTDRSAKPTDRSKAVYNPPLFCYPEITEVKLL